MRDFLHHLFLPRESNNHRAKILHHTSVLVVILLLFVLEFSFSFLHAKRGDILGVRTNIVVSDLLSLTNKKRTENGLSPLQLNEELSNAASQKASDMLAKNYWAHNSPDGTTPWIFIKSSGYEYLYAGENLARGFTASADIVDAWMNSPGHRENMLSSNYKDVGFSVVPGVLTGDETILVVEMFGQERGGNAEVSQSEEEVAQAIAPDTVESRPSQQSSSGKAGAIASSQTQPLFDVKHVTKGISLIILFVFVGTLLLDLIIIKRKNIARIIAHNIDTILFLLVIAATIFIIGNGVII